MEGFGCFGACQERVFEGIRGGSRDNRERGGAQGEKIQDSMSPGFILLTIIRGQFFLSLSPPLPLAPPITTEEEELPNSSRKVAFLEGLGFSEPVLLP